MFLGGIPLAALTGSSIRGVLDGLSVQAAAAYGLRRLRAGYTSPAINVRRSSDNAATDIGFTGAGALDTTTLLAFVGSGSGYVTTWYDQSGNGRHATQATATAQPVIVNAGALVTQNGRSSIVFDGTRYLQTAYNYSGIIAATVNAVASTTNANPSSVKHIWQDRGSSGVSITLSQSIPTKASTTYGISGDASGFAQGIVSSVDVSNGNLHVVSGTWSGANGVAIAPAQFAIRLDGNALSTSSATTGTINAPISGSGGAIIGGSSGGTPAPDWTGGMSELLFAISTFAAPDLQFLERNQGQFFGITVA